MLLATALGQSGAHGAALPLVGTVDGESAYYEYFSDGFVQMDLFSPTQPTNQSFHAISDPDIIYNQGYDAFPNDAEFHLGQLDYDASGLPDGTGQAPVTALTLGFAADPFDETYVHFSRFTLNTIVNGLTGAVELLDGVPVSADIEADITFELVNPLGATMTGEYDGAFSIEGNRFTLFVEGTRALDVFGNDPPADFPVEFDFAGTLYNLPKGDYNADGVVDALDYQRWRAAYGLGDLAADANGDRTINAVDYVAWRDALTARGNGAASIPEPAAVLIATSMIGWGLGQLRAARAANR